MTITDEMQISHRREIASRFSSQPLRIPREQFGTIVRLMAQELPDHIATGLLAVAWLVEVETFRQAEEAFLLDDTYEAMRLDHRSYLSKLIGDGEQIIWSIKQKGMSAKDFKFTPEDVQATLDSLHITFQCEHGPKNSEKTNKAIADLF
jgi:hypothetical protein